ncbi:MULTISPECIES: PAAR domain-containing protein [Marinobacter]|uniref:Zn-binding Pro-Ala-Ala-Arg (PAAR) domain-containing protein, incolved in TypeVI secretion n=1 Tax=Marinobacter nauticus TaxID=2743 RepID=A0A455W7T2_MARNT|nr:MULTISPECIES: PAAR domain-containing protein [Marinobacter]MDX5440865.1 PAAR domain-containing protein [Alteromonadaceae bacterium]MCA0913203.1 PAAR domain-containing protein [Marinobacter nauticus]MDX5335745.1 PAAR domain-containing protein [Marinobacter sp.]MDX5386741.1 PAAR domain-containing protein [Marinobacter sp.]MDX5472152.1 PAAR domain-containing protein [Marinobacter sp.]|tara:strand:+ start:115 stop:405 length:291 start_codon:yes stop_codon:yes gene_type:complete
MGIPVSLKGHYHMCPMFSGNTPHVGGGIAEGDGAFTVNGTPVALQGHKCNCKVGGPDTLSQGAPGLTVNGVPVVLQGSATAHGGVVLEGDPAVTVA